MNKQRRKQIADLIQQLDELIDTAEGIAGEERDYYDNMPENMQNGEKGEQASAAADALDSARSSLEDAKNYLEEAAQ